MWLCKVKLNKSASWCVSVVLVVNGYNRNACTTYRSRQLCAPSAQLQKNARFRTFRGGRQRVLEKGGVVKVMQKWWDVLVPSTANHGPLGRGWSIFVAVHRESLFSMVQGGVRLVATLDATTMQPTLTLLFVDCVRATFEIVSKTQPVTLGCGSRDISNCKQLMRNAGTARALRFSFPFW